MHPEEEGLIDSLVEFGKRALQKNLIWGNSGNISHRLHEERMIITASGAPLGELDRNEFAVVNVKTGETEGETVPSIEMKMHTAIYKVNAGVKAVFHSQAFFTTLVSCTDLHVDTNLFPESMAYIGKVGRVPYHHPGSKELAGAVAGKAGECDCIILSNHGALCAAESLGQVLLKTETLEMLCRLIAVSNIDNIDLNYLPDEVRMDFLEHLETIRGTNLGDVHGQ